MGTPCTTGTCNAVAAAIVGEWLAGFWASGSFGSLAPWLAPQHPGGKQTPGPGVAASACGDGSRAAAQGHFCARARLQWRRCCQNCRTRCTPCRQTRWLVARSANRLAARAQWFSQRASRSQRTSSSEAPARIKQDRSCIPRAPARPGAAAVGLGGPPAASAAAASNRPELLPQQLPPPVTWDPRWLAIAQRRQRKLLLRNSRNSSEPTRSSSHESTGRPLSVLAAAFAFAFTEAVQPSPVEGRSEQLKP